MILKDLIAWLEAVPEGTVFPLGFGDPHSYRGTYSELGFEPMRNVSIAKMLGDARYALGNTFTGYKGGEYTMGEYTDVYLARWGESGEGIGPILLSLLLEKAQAVSTQEES